MKIGIFLMIIFGVAGMIAVVLEWKNIKRPWSKEDDVMT